MSSLKKFMAGALVALVVGIGLGSSGFMVGKAQGQTRNAVSKIRTFSGSITTSAVVLTGATGTNLHVLSMHVRSDTAGVVVFQDGASGTTLANIYMAANTPQQIFEILGPNGLVCTQNTLAAVLSGATLTLTANTQDGP